uniref:Uncharacterized protein n=1 Tax=Caenorhabditis japonica TaxID=281687 RepID=A0A8R1IB19_CAEJA
MYWPVFFALPDNHVEEHVAALTKCNSFSGKYASHFLLTASTDEEEGVEKKYDDAYQDSEGIWEEYCQKPGRFSKRKGFQPENTKCTDSFEVQKNRAIDANRNAFEREKKAMDEFGRLKREFEENHNKAQY